MSKLKVRTYITKPGAPAWDANKQTYQEYLDEYCIPWDSLSSEEREEMANKINQMAMKACGYVPVKEGAEQSA